MRPGSIRGSGRRAGPAAEPGYVCLRRADPGVRRAGSGAASCAADGCCNGRRTRRGPAAGAVRRRSRHSRRALAIQRSAIAFARGAWTGVFTIRTPIAVNTASNAAVNFVSRSRIKNFKPSARPSRFISRLRARWVTHAPVGWAVTPARCTRRVPCSMKNSTYRRRRNTVSTWKKSAARIVLACLVRNARQVWPLRRGAGSMPASLRICHTVDGASLYPRPVSSPWCGGIPRPGCPVPSPAPAPVWPALCAACRECAAGTPSAASPGRRASAAGCAGR